ncbi:MAG TPA: hypothetical protein VHD56_07540 [Tepidisphaeraceae bacterium]|nr:hypothetical protein [Tepidisphaeraceae bacterium]
MLFLQIRQAEVAMADGRLDEAFGLIANSPDLRNHRRGQTIVTELVERLVERAKSHLKEGRTSQALTDAEKAQQLGGNLPQVVAIRSQIESEIISIDRAQREQAKAGMLVNATQLVDSALGRQDVDRAVAELIRARGNGITDTRLREADADVRKTLGSQIETALDTGRLDQVDSLLDRLQRLDPEGLPIKQYSQAIEQARDAWAAIARGKSYDAQEVLHRLAVLLPDAKWIRIAIQQLEAAEESLRNVRTGPLGLLEINGAQPRNINVSPVAWAGHRRDNSFMSQALPNKFVLQVDGAGSYLVLCQPTVTFGPLSSSRTPDVGLLAEPGAPVVTIQRREDDYFLAGASGGTPGKLLSAGERISLSTRCRLMFNLPNPSSTSAVLDLVAGRFPRSDIRRVILLDRDLIIGPGNGSHARADQVSEPVVLHVRDGNLWCRTQAIELDKPATVAGVSFVVTKG